MLKKCLKNIAQTWVIIMICMFRLIHYCSQRFLKKFRDKCIEIYGLDPSYFYSAPGLAWQPCFKKINVKLELSTDIDMLLMIDKELEVKCVNQYISMLKQIINT